MLKGKWKFDPYNVTQYDRTEEELQLFWLFCIFVSGKAADRAVVCLEKALSDCPAFPLTYLSNKDKVGQLDAILRSSKIGQYTRIQRAIAGSWWLDLVESPLEELLGVHGVGNKTARFFILHSREGVDNIAVLDTHIMKWVRSRFPEAPYPVPKATYALWEDRTLWLMRQEFPGETIADIDLRLWKEYKDASN